MDNFVDGAAVARIGDLPFAAARFRARTGLSAPEDRICATMLEMLNIGESVLEPAGALAVDVLRDIPDLAGKRVVCICSGGNFDFERLPRSRNARSAIPGSSAISSCACRNAPGAADFPATAGP